MPTQDIKTFTKQMNFGTNFSHDLSDFNISSQFPFRVELAMDPGEIHFQETEDRAVIAHSGKLCAVFDGVSGLYHPASGPFRVQNGQTSAQFVGDVVKRFLVRSHETTSLPDLLKFANDAVATAVSDLFPSSFKAIDRPALVGAAALVVPSHSTEAAKIEIATWGDSFACWRTKSGEIGITTNQLNNVERTLKRIKDRLIDLHTNNGELEYNDQIRDEVWLKYINEYRSVVEPLINDIENPNSFGMLNGDSGFLNMVQYSTLPLIDIEQLLLFTDGIIVGDEMKDPSTFAKRILNAHHSDGVVGIHLASRALQAEIAKGIHPKFPEAAVIGFHSQGSMGRYP